MVTGVKEGNNDLSMDTFKTQERKSTPPPLVHKFRTRCFIFRGFFPVLWCVA